MKILKYCLIVAVSGLVGVATGARAASIGVQIIDQIDIQNNTGTAIPNNSTTAGVASVAQNHWNVCIVPQSTTSAYGGGSPYVVTNVIFDSTGATTPLTVGVSGYEYGTGGGFTSADPNQAGDNALASVEMLSIFGTPATIGITNIPYANYNIYVYLACDSSGRAGTASIGGNSQTYLSTKIADSGNTAAWVTTVFGGTADYLEFAGLSGSSQTITLLVPSNGGMEGFQIVPVTGNPPAAPTGLNATGGINQVGLIWSAGSGATSYNVYRGTSAGHESDAPIATNITSTTYTDTSVAAGTTYYYKVVAVNSYGNSVNGSGTVAGASNEASAVPQLGQAPVAPTGLTAQSQAGQILLLWNASAGATSYNVYRGTSPGGESGTAIATGIVSSPYADTNIVVGTTYYYEVAAVNSYGSSTKSSEASATANNSGAGTSVGVQFLMVQNQSQALNTSGSAYTNFFGPNNGGTNANWKAGYAPVAQTNWNSVGIVYLGNFTTANAINLMDASGAPTTVAVSTHGFAYSSYGGFDTTDPNQTGDNILAGNSLLSVWGNAATLNLSGIPYGQYTIYFYVANGGNNGPGYVTNNTTGQVISYTTGTASAGSTSGWVPASNGSVGSVLIFTNLTGSSQNFSILVPGNGGFNGVQIVSSTGASVGIQFWLDQGSGTLDLHTPAPVNLPAGAPSFVQSNWNSIITAYQGTIITNTYNNLINSAGASVNPLLVTATGTANAEAQYFNPGHSNWIGDSDLIGGLLTPASSGNVVVGITNIPYSQYDIVLYLNYFADGQPGYATIGNNTQNYYTMYTTYFTTNGDWITISDANTFYANYLVFTNLVGSSQTVTLTLPSGGALNAFQIVSTAAAVPSQIPLSISLVNGNVTLTWSNSAFELESSSNVNGPYTVIPGATSPYTVSASATRQFYRLYWSP